MKYKMKRQKLSSTDIIKEKPFFITRGIKGFKKTIPQTKKEPLKNRFRTLIGSKGITEPEFYNKLEISAQLWYYISWGIWEPSLHLKLKIAKALETDSYFLFGDIDYSDTQHKLNEPKEEVN